MEVAVSIFVQIGIMAILLAVGFGLKKSKVVTNVGEKQISSIILKIVCPVLIFMAYQTEYSKDMAYGIAWSLLLSLISVVFGIIIVTILVPKKSANSVIDRFSMIYSNCGFIGIPLVSGVFGTEGVLYVTSYLAFFNIFVWSHGDMTMRGDSNLKGILKSLRSPVIIATVLGLIFYFTNIRLPKIPYEALNYIASLNTPLAMLVAGSKVADSNVLKAVKTPMILVDCVVKLILLPIAMMLILKPFNVPSEVIFTTIIIATACPTATIGTLFAIKYNKDAVYASEIFALSTLLSGVTLPLIVMVSQYVYNF